MSLHENSQITLLTQLYDFSDWMIHWDEPRSAREEAHYYDVLGKIAQNKLTFNQVAHKLKSSIDKFLDDFQKEPSLNITVGSAFVKKGNSILELLNQPTLTFEHDAELLPDVKRLLEVTVKKVSNIMALE